MYVCVCTCVFKVAFCAYSSTLYPYLYHILFLPLPSPLPHPPTHTQKKPHHRFEKLGQWDQALHAYDQLTSGRHVAVELSLRRMNCLNELARWNEMLATVRACWDEVPAKEEEKEGVGLDKYSRGGMVVGMETMITYAVHYKLPIFLSACSIFPRVLWNIFPLSSFPPHFFSLFRCFFLFRPTQDSESRWPPLRAPLQRV